MIQLWIFSGSEQTIKKQIKLLISLLSLQTFDNIHQLITICIGCCSPKTTSNLPKTSSICVKPSINLKANGQLISRILNRTFSSLKRTLSIRSNYTLRNPSFFVFSISLFGGWRWPLKLWKIHPFSYNSIDLWYKWI